MKTESRETWFQQDQQIADGLAAMTLIAHQRTVSAGDRRRFGRIERRVRLLSEYQRIEAETLLTLEQRAEGREWQRIVFAGREYRAGLTGTPITLPAAESGNLQTFVPVDFFREKLPQTMAVISPLLNDKVVNLIRTPKAIPLEVPILSDIANVAVAVAEGVQDTGADLAKPGAKLLGGFRYKSPMFISSLEAWQDVESAYGLMNTAQDFLASRLARGVGVDLLNGNGVGKPSGLIPQLSTAGAVPIIAAGSANNTGGTESGANTVGSADIAKLYSSVPAVYRQSPRCAWIMHDNTFQYLRALVSRQGTPVFASGVLDVMPGDAAGWLLGKPVYVDNGMPQLAASATTILFGDFSYVYTRWVTNDNYLRRFLEAPGFVEKGLVGLRAFGRADIALAYNDPNQPAPINSLQQHS